MKLGARPTVRTKRRGAHARRPQRPLPQRFRPRLPSAGRATAGLLFAGLLAGLIVLLNGPWLRVERVTFAGHELTSEAQLASALGSLQGSSLLSLDSQGIASRLRSLPAVADARVDAILLDQVRLTITEKRPAFVWRTSVGRLIGAQDGSLLASRPLDGELPGELRDLPFIDDRRGTSAALHIGDVLPSGVVDTALKLVALDPQRLGSVAKRLSVRIDDEFGFVLVSSKPGWQAAFGLYGMDPTDDQPRDGRIEQQVAAVRTLFASHPEASVTWADVRNPGKVYFHAKG